MDAIDTIEFSDHSVTAWSSMKLMKDLLDASKLKEELSQLLLSDKGSNRGYEPTQILEFFWTVFGLVQDDLVIRLICVTMMF